MYLLDTNVVSALSPAPRGSAHPLVAWLQANTGVLYVSVVTIAELEAGSAKLRRSGADHRAKLIAHWIEAMVALFADRVLAFGINEARVAGVLHDQARASGVEPGFADVAIAATAKEHKLTVLTRNLRHFSAFGVPAQDPFETLPPDGASEGRHN
jgi:predicted nucleic acid-binding protein